MTIYTEDNLFNLKAVVQETGLKPDTLRAWERRYNMPNPTRSSGKHRLYSQHDIDLLKWLMARQEEGVTIKRAVELWRTIESEGQNPLVVMPLVAPPPSNGQLQFTISGDALDHARASWIDACLSFDEQRANSILSQSFAMYGPETVVLELIRKAVVTIGNGWHAGTVTVQQEHFASELATRQLEALIGASPAPTRPERIVVGCPPTELHAFPALVLTFLLRRHGWHTIFLGANVPAGHFRTAVTQTKPNLVILPAQLLSTAATMLDMAKILHEEGIPMAYGGMIFTVIPALRKRFDGHYLGDSLEAAPRMIAELFSAPPPEKKVVTLSEEMQEALAHFRERIPFIHARVWEVLRPNGSPPTAATIATANLRMASNIESALKLGDINFLGSDFGWLQLWVDEDELPDESLENYLSVYAQATASELDERGAAILTWFASVAPASVTLHSAA